MQRNYQACGKYDHDAFNLRLPDPNFGLINTSMIPLRRTVTIATSEHLSEHCCEISTPLKIQKTLITFSFFFFFVPLRGLGCSSSSTGIHLYFKTLHADDSYFDSFCSFFNYGSCHFKWYLSTSINFVRYIRSELKAGRRHIGGGLCWLPAAGM